MREDIAMKTQEITELNAKHKLELVDRLEALKTDLERNFAEQLRELCEAQREERLASESLLLN